MITVIADDLTGACDAGALYAGRHRVPVLIGEGATLGLDAGRDAVVLDTETRALGPVSAAARITAAARAVGDRANAGPLFKKIDSTLRGAVGAEVAALLSATGHRTVVVCPAFPDQSRTVINGVLKVAGTPVHESAIGQDPDFRAATSSVVEILERGSAHRVRHWPLDRVRGDRHRLLDDLEAADERLIAADAERDTDLDVIAEVALSRPGIALSGSAGLARAVAGARAYPSARVALPRGRAWLFLAGSLHPATRAQLRALDAAGVAGIHLDDASDPDLKPLVGALEHGRPAFIATSAEVATPRSDAAAWRLASATYTILSQIRPDVVVVTGGDTARVVLGALDGDRLELRGVPASGLALAEIAIGPMRGLSLVTKAGGFGAPDLFVDLLDGTSR